MSKAELPWSVQQITRYRLSLRVRIMWFILTRGMDPAADAYLDSRSSLQIKYIARLASYVSSPVSSVEDNMAMVEFLEGPRTEILNLNVLDENKGTGLLHEASRSAPGHFHFGRKLTRIYSRRDLRLVELAVKRGADVFVRDKRGRRVLDEKSGDERIKAFLRQCAYMSAPCGMYIEMSLAAS